jgi:hypothetical protein
MSCLQRSLIVPSCPTNASMVRKLLLIITAAALMNFRAEIDVIPSPAAAALISSLYKLVTPALSYPQQFSFRSTECLSYTHSFNLRFQLFFLSSSIAFWVWLPGFIQAQVGPTSSSNSLSLACPLLSRRLGIKSAIPPVQVQYSEPYSTCSSDLKLRISCLPHLCDWGDSRIRFLCKLVYWTLPLSDLVDSE